MRGRAESRQSRDASKGATCLCVVVVAVCCCFLSLLVFFCCLSREHVMISSSGHRPHQVELYDPRTSAWVICPQSEQDFGAHVSAHSATVLSDHEFLVLGGQRTHGRAEPPAVLFDVRANRTQDVAGADPSVASQIWAAAALPSAIYSHSVALIHLSDDQ